MNLKELKDIAENPLLDSIRRGAVGLAIGHAYVELAREKEAKNAEFAPAQPSSGTWCRCGAGVPMCGTHTAAPWILSDGSWYCSRACVPE